jgi:hypothetical protein
VNRTANGPSDEFIVREEVQSVAVLLQEGAAPPVNLLAIRRQKNDRPLRTEQLPRAMQHLPLCALNIHLDDIGSRLLLDIGIEARAGNAEQAIAGNLTLSEGDRFVRPTHGSRHDHAILETIERNVAT